MGGFLLTLFALIGLSAWTAYKEDELNTELSRNYCENCGAEMLETDEHCVICGADNAKFVKESSNEEAAQGVVVSEVCDEDEVMP